MTTTDQRIFVRSKNDWETKHSVTPLYHSIKKEGKYLTWIHPLKITSTIGLKELTNPLKKPDYSPKTKAGTLQLIDFSRPDGCGLENRPTA